MADIVMCMQCNGSVRSLNGAMYAKKNCQYTNKICANFFLCN